MGYLFNHLTGKILLLQREIPEYVNIVAARIAKEAGTMVILDVGGRDEPLSEDLLVNIDIISPNEVKTCFANLMIRLSLKESSRRSYPMKTKCTKR
jgi:sugar/nucleoside kinase (ribokinase family)